MIGVVASIAAGLILKEYAMLFTPIIFVISLKNRDAGLIAYFLYALYSSSKVLSLDVYTYEELIKAFIFALSGVLLLEDILRRTVKVNKSEVIPIIFILLGFLLPESFIAGGILYFLALKPGWKTGIPAAGVLIAFVVFESYIAGLGPSDQVVIFASFAFFTLAVEFLLKDIKKVDMFGG
jgi:hypothetical protein